MIKHYIVLLLVFLSVYFNYIILLQLLYKNKLKLDDRMDKYLRDEYASYSREKKISLKRIFFDRLGRILIREKRSRKLALQLMRAGIPLKSEEFVSIVFISTVIPSIIIFLLFRNLFAAIIVSIAGYLIPKLILKTAIQKRLNKFNLQLPDAVNIIINSLKSGLSLIQAMESVASEMSEPISSEFERVVNEITVLGRRKEEALQNMNKRVNSDDLDLVITAIIIQSQIGGNLAEILENIVETVRDRIKIKREIKALTAQGRMSGIIVASIPVFIGAFILIIDPSYFKPFFAHPIGWALTIYSIISEVLGFVLIKKIISVDI